MGKKLIAVVLLLMLSELDIYRINTRRTYYPSLLLARIFENKFNYTLRHYSGRLLKVVDINGYLFSSHPREGDTNGF